VLAETHLCSSGAAGEIIRDADFNPVIECMCGNVIGERFDPAKDFFTKRGSFWTNCTTDLLAATTDADRQTRTRNRCNGQGYESVGLFALRSGENRLGLLQLNDKRRGMFSTTSLALWEKLADHLSVAIAKFLAEESRERSASRFALLATTAGDLLGAPDPQSRIDLLCRRVMEQLDCQVFFNFLVDEGSQRLRLNACAGIPPEEAAKIEWLDFGVAVCGCAARDGCRIVAEHILESDDPRAELVKSYGIDAYACHPLFGPGDRVIGTISFGTRKRTFFAPEELDLMKAVADHISTAMRRMQADEELRKYRGELEKLVDERTTALRKSQELLLHAQKMEAMGQLAGGIAHDFNNMMQVVTGFTHRTLRKLDFDSPLRENLEHIRLAAKSAADLTHRLLAFSSRQMLQPEVFSLNDLLLKVKPMLRHSLCEDVAITFNLQPDIDFVKADPVQIEQVIMNMAVNARMAMADGGTLKLETANVALGEVHPFDKDPVPPGCYVMIAISDSGCGMDAKTMEKIFEPFFTTRRVGSGSGLGLAMAYGTIRQSGGVIRVYSEPGRGTTFKIYLPRCDEKPQKQVQANIMAPTGGSGKTVLVVEDNIMALEFTRLELQELGYEVLTARNGDEALSVARRYAKRIHLLVSDVVLPGMSGREVSEVISAQWPEIVTLYISGYDKDNIIKQGKLVPGARLLVKPFSPEQLAMAINEAFAGAEQRTTSTPEGPDLIVDATAIKQPLHMLIVDDDPGIADLIAEIVREPGDVVKTADDGASALAVTDSIMPGVVLLDIKLPDMDGYELARRIREKCDGAPPYIIAASGYSPEAGAPKELFDEFLIKPIDFAKLKELIVGRKS
jgi:signal transduction histidine kinase/DNA-binding response OmpR family regulator